MSEGRIESTGTRADSTHQADQAKDVEPGTLCLPAGGTACWLRWRGWVVPLAVLLAIVLPKLGQGDWRGDTGWYAAIAHQAIATGEFWTLYAEPGEPYFNKPPLAFWIHGLVLDATAIRLEFARLPTVFAAAGVVLLTVAIGRTLAGPRVGYASGVVCALTYEFFRRSREISLDMWQCLWLMLALYCVAVGWRRGNGSRVLLGGVFVGFALMTKPFVGLLAIPILLGWAVWMRWWRGVAWLCAAGVLAALVAAPWHVSMVVLHGDAFVDQYIGREIGGRIEDKLDDGLRLWYYLRAIWLRYWPWVVPLVLAVVSLLRGRGLSRNAGVVSLAVCWTVGWLVFLSVFPDKRPRYALVLWPSLAILVGAWLANRAPWWMRRGRFGLDVLGAAVVCVGVAIAVLPVRVQDAPNPAWGELFAWMEERGVGRGELWQGAFIGTRGARVYLENGWWPEPTRGAGGRFIADPPEGAYLVYHADDGWVPGPGERVVFTSGDLIVSELERGPWQPVRAASDRGD